MLKTLTSSAAALPMLLCAAPALADSPANTVPELPRADGHAPAGVIVDHVHKAGEVMVGLTWMHDSASGTNLRGNDSIGDSDVVAAGFTARTESMTMDMAMLHVMYAPSNRVTLMVMPSWQTMAMTMRGIAPSYGGHHALAVGETMTHRVSGIGDTQVGALVALSRRPALSAHASLLVSVPTGSVSRRDEDGNYVHYGMQPGSGTWDLIPAFTLRGSQPGFGWGAQLSYVFRAEDANSSGFRFGDRFSATGWVSKPLGERVSISARAIYTSEGPVSGHYSAGHNHAAPPDRQANYGGRRLEAALGVNAVLGKHLRLGVEGTLPVCQRVNGIQAPRKYGLSVNLSRGF